jgi:serine/threonine protein kinase/dienelactone hydrolase
MNQTENQHAGPGSRREVVPGEPFRTGEDPCVARALEEYLAALEAGQQPSRQEFLSRHPEIAGPLAECIDGLEFVNRVAPQVDLPLLHEMPGAYSANMAIQPRAPLGDFHILREIGRGGMGVVYEAEQVSLGRRVALKVLPFAAAMDTKQLQRFKNESHAAAQLHHTNIVPVFGVGCERGVHYYAMQYIEGQTLAAVVWELRRHVQAPMTNDQRMTKEQFPSTKDPAAGANIKTDLRHSTVDIVSSFGIGHASFFRSVAHLGIQAAEALEHAHQLGVVHRDIKPANLLLEWRAGGVNLPVLWITDFGLAHCQSQAGLTITGDLVGTLRYMSPEQALAKRLLIDHRTDIYSLGVTLYELLTLEPAFGGNDREELLQQVAFEEPPPPRLRNKAIPHELETIVLKAIQKSPEARYATAQELADDLRRFLEDKPIQAKRPTLLQRATKWARRHKTVVRVTAVVLGIAVSALVVSALLIGRAQERTQQEQLMREVMIPKIRGLVEEKNYCAAFDLAEIAEKVIAQDPTLAELRPKFTSFWTVTTDPSGADVSAKPYDRPQDDWQYLGPSPLHRVRLARGFFRWRVTKAGFTPVEGFREPVQGRIQFTLDPAGSLPDGMVRVTGNAYRENSEDVKDPYTLDLDDFLIDRCEVTNLQFKQFVDQGGYRERKYWNQPFLHDKTLLSWEEAVKRFRDQTGQPGPAPWRSGTYPAGEEDYPVQGISWYEAAAYAEFAHKSLPTVAHWFRASGYQNSGEITPLSNFGRAGPAAVGTYAGLGPFGTVDMAGNVKEWCWNQSEGDRRYILGGAWNEPGYMFLNRDTAPSLDRSPVNSFRCMRYLSDKIPPTAVQAMLEEYRDYRKEKPVSDEIFQSYKSLWGYNRGRLHACIESTDTSADSIHQKITFDAAYGKERVNAHLYLPQKGKRPYQTVVFFPGGNYLEKRAFPRENPPIEVAFLVRSGRAALWPVYKGTCERWDPDREEQERTPSGRLFARIQEYHDLERSVDYLQERSDIDRKKLAYFGASTGALFGIRFLALDDRFKAGVLAFGGLPSFRIPLPELDFIHYVPRVRVPVLMINSRNDPTFPLETSQKPMFQLLGTAQKRHLRYDVPGHAFEWELFEKEMLSWLDQYLGKVR